MDGTDRQTDRQTDGHPSDTYTLLRILYTGWQWRNCNASWLSPPSCRYNSDKCISLWYRWNTLCWQASDHTEFHKLTDRMLYNTHTHARTHARTHAHTHTHTTVKRPFVRDYPIITHSLSTSSIYNDPWHPLCSVYELDSLLGQPLSRSSLVLFLSSWPWTLNFILHAFLHPVIIIFSQHMPIPTQPVLLQYQCYVVYT